MIRITFTEEPPTPRTAQLDARRYTAPNSVLDTATLSPIPFCRVVSIRTLVVCHTQGSVRAQWPDHSRRVLSPPDTNQRNAGPLNGHAATGNGPPGVLVHQGCCQTAHQAFVHPSRD